MRARRWTLAHAAVLSACFAVPCRAAGGPYEQSSPVRRALYTGVAVVANVVPGISAIYAPQCLPGYVLCKLTFAGISVLAAADQLALSGAQDLTQTRAILHRGFAGDWILTGRHIAGEAEAHPLPEPPPPPSEGGWQPPPL